MASISNLRATDQPRSPAITAAAILYMFFGAAIFLSNIPIIAHIISKRAFPVVFGIPLLGNPYVDNLGWDFIIRASLVFEVVLALDVLACGSQPGRACGWRLYSCLSDCPSGYCFSFRSLFSWARSEL